MEFALLWLLCGFVAMAIGHGKGEGCGAFILGCLLGPFGILAAIVSKGDRKQCPWCRQWIDPEALVCHHCQRDQPRPQAVDSSRPHAAQAGPGPLTKAARQIGRWIGRLNR